MDLKSIQDAIDSKDISKIKELMKKYDLIIENNKLVPRDKHKIKQEASFWDQRQYVRKILLNSLYGALLNEGCRFYDQRIGQSVTLSGRSIAKHMNATSNKAITGEYNHTGDAIIYSDTDSSYFSAYDMLQAQGYDPNDKDMYVKLYDEVAEQVNNSFPDFMNSVFNTGLEKGSIIKAGRELVASKGLFITKKRYAVLVFDKEGKRLDKNSPGKIKAMGLDLKRSDTPKMMQEFLESILLDLLTGANKEAIFDKIKQFRNDFRSLPGWQKGTPKKVNGISDYQDRLDKLEKIDFRIKQKEEKNKITIPGHVRAAINWNKLKQIHHDNYSMEIQDGQKVIVCKLKPNQYRINSIAYPFDEPHLPEWFRTLPFDHEEMEHAIISKKIENLLGCLNWDLTMALDNTTFDEFFSF